MKQLGQSGYIRVDASDHSSLAANDEIETDDENEKHSFVDTSDDEDDDDEDGSDDEDSDESDSDSTDKEDDDEDESDSDSDDDSNSGSSEEDVVDDEDDDDEEEDEDEDEVDFLNKDKKEKRYKYGQKLTAGWDETEGQQILTNLPSRFLCVHEYFPEQSHMAPVAWKRIFYHYREDELFNKLPNDARSKLIDNEEEQIEFEVMEWDEIKKEDEDDDIDDNEEDEEQKHGEKKTDVAVTNPIDLILQEIPDDINDVVSFDKIFSMRDIYKSESATVNKFRSQNKAFGEMVQAYVDKFELHPLPKNLQTETYQQPRFIANFSGIKSFYEYCATNTYYEQLIEENEDDSDDDEDDELDDIVWNPWYVYRVRIWAKYTDKDWKDAMEDDEKDDDDDDSNDSDDSDDDDDAEEKSKQKKKKKKNGRYMTAKLSSDDPIGYKLVSDHFVCQNDHIFGRPTRFYWDDSIDEEHHGNMEHKFGHFLYELQDEYAFPNLSHPLYVHEDMNLTDNLSDGIFCNGLSFLIGKDTPYDLISIDARIPPVSQLYNMTVPAMWKDGWGAISISPYKVWKEQGEFQRGVFVYGDRMDPEHNDYEAAFEDNEDDEEEGWIINDQIPFRCNAFFFNNHWMRMFKEPDPTAKDSSRESDGYTLAVMNIHNDEEYYHGKNRDTWTITVGFTHPRPNHNPSVILWKNNSIEIRVRSDYDYVNDKDKTGYMFKQEMLEIFLIYMTRGGKREKVLSVPIRTNFGEDYLIHDGDMVVVGDECVNSHILICTKTTDGEFYAYLDGVKVCQHKINGKNSTHLLQKSKNEQHLDLPFQLCLGHKRTGDDGIGKCIDIFHGYIYDVAIFPKSLQEFELNILYRSLKVDHDIHLRKHWNKQHKKFKQDNANLNFRV